jgi:hypothetical protein
LSRTWLGLAWEGLVSLVFLFAAGVAIALATGHLDPLGFAYYGVGMSWREPVLFTLLALLQGVSLVDAVVLARRRRGGWWWARLALAALTLPFLLVLALARLDLWRFAQRSPFANVLAGFLMMALLALAFLLRLWVWRLSDPPRPPSPPVS